MPCLSRLKESGAVIYDETDRISGYADLLAAVAAGVVVS